ncbi:MAG: hypothetical protein RQ856_04930 [Candidatus Izemoplasmatales bacterium]|nr:hypothetical protein [Candidatus Izemoplasmatales bacterium]
MEDKDRIYNESMIEEEPGISLKEIFTVVWNWKWVLIIITFIGLFVSVFAGYLVNKSDVQVATVVELQWDGISLGEYPDGQRFDYGTALDGPVYGNVIDKLALDMSVDELKSSIRITPIVPNDVQEIIINSLEKGENYSYYPTSFTFSLDFSALSITEANAKNILTELVDGFRTEFERKYVQRTVILDYTEVSLDEYDYIEAYEILNSQVTLINNAINNVMPSGNEFVSSTLGIGFNDILVRTSVLRTIELNNMESRINNYLLSKDKDLLVTIYQYRVEQFELSLAKEEDVESGLQTLIDNYVGSTSTIIIPGLDSGYNLDTDPYLNTLYANLVATKTKIATYEQDIIYYNLRINRLEGNDPLFVVTPEKEAAEIANVEESIVNASNVLSDIVEDVDVLLTEYNLFVTRGLVKTLMPPQLVAGTSMIIYGAIGTILGGIIGFGVIFLLDYNANKKKEKKQEKE